MYERTYIDPSIKLIDQSIPDLGFFLWLKSRQWVVTNEAGERFMVNAEPNAMWLLDIPDEFYVGGEKVKLFEYMKRIAAMNLQYMNTENFLFEIDGSCLFRDILYNINKLGVWAQSNRFLFSILSGDAIYDSKNYHISSEYKGIKEWEDQFDTYMDAIKNDPIVDHNRIEMPYSISSKFWISINRKTLVDILLFLKTRAPFFYQVYGKLFMDNCKFITDEELKGREVSAAITQYVNKSINSWEEGTWKIGDTVLVNSKMGLILYSQFIRQADTRITGLYNEIIHSDVEEFKHKVFKGGTILNIHYVADIDKVRSTVSTRLCAFAMSSGNDPCSWSYFLNRFIPENISPKELMDLLPCKFKGTKMTYCKFHDDVKFRNEGKEVSNCPCPLVSLSMKDAEAKRERDNNRIGDAYYALTKYLISGGTPYHYETEEWTSTLRIDADIELDDELVKAITFDLQEIEFKLSKFSKTAKVEETEFYKRYGGFGLGTDMTCILKGYAIDEIRKRLDSWGATSYLINFGGDIFGHNVERNISIVDTDFSVRVRGNFSVFTSGNTAKRGNHIVGGEEGLQSTVVINWYTEVNNILVDALATHLVANDPCIGKIIKVDLDGNDIRVFSFKDGKFLDQTYCASPFFDDKQIEIRDNMISNFANAFRPDLTESSAKFEFGDNSQAAEVVRENEEGILKGYFLVYPKHTLDLGTLYEVGYALAYNRTVIQYDEESKRYTILAIARDYAYQLTESNYIFDCSRVADVISLGFASRSVPKEKIFYELKGQRDNLMLSVNYTHVEKNSDGKYELVIRDENDRDTRPL